MFLITRTYTTGEPDEDGNMKTIRRLDDCRVETLPVQAAQLIDRIRIGDHRVAGCRVFELEVTEDGYPTLGKELTPG